MVTADIAKRIFRTAIAGAAGAHVIFEDMKPADWDGSGRLFG